MQNVIGYNPNDIICGFNDYNYILLSEIKNVLYSVRSMYTSSPSHYGAQISSFQVN